MGKADVQQVEPQWAIAAKVLKICVVAQLVIAICIIELENNSFNGGGNLAILCILQTDGKMDMAKTPKNSLDIWGNMSMRKHSCYGIIIYMKDNL